MRARALERAVASVPRLRAHAKGPLAPDPAPVGQCTNEPVVESQPPTPPTGGSRARRAVALSLRTSLLLQFINAASGIELAHGLGLAGRGALAAAMIWPGVIGAIATLGLEESMTFHVARDPDGVGRFLGSALVLWVLQSFVFIGVSAALIPLALHSHGADVRQAAFIYVLYVPFNMLAVTLNGTLNGLHRYEWFNWVRLIVGVLVIVIQTVLLVTGLIGVRVLVIAFVSSYLATALVAAVLVRRAAHARLSWEGATMRAIFGYGIRSHASTTSAFLNGRLDQLVISAFLSTRQLALYVIGVTLTSVTIVVGSSVAYATLPNVASLGATSEQVRLARRLVSLTLLLSAMLALPVIVFAPQLIHLFFGSAFVPAQNIARVLAVAAVAMSVNRSLEAVLRGVGRPLDAGVSELVALGATVATLAGLLPALGLIGAAYASLIAYVVANAWMLRRVKRAVGIAAHDILRPDREAITLLSSRLRAAVASGRRRRFSSARSRV